MYTVHVHSHYVHVHGYPSAQFVMELGSPSHNEVPPPVPETPEPASSSVSPPTTVQPSDPDRSPISISDYEHEVSELSCTCT